MEEEDEDAEKDFKGEDGFDNNKNHGQNDDHSNI